MRTLLVVGLLPVVLLLSGCSLVSGSAVRGPRPTYFAVSSRVEPVWQGWRDDSIEHLRLRLWLIDAADSAGLRNTYDPRVKTVFLSGTLGHELGSRIQPAGRDDPPFGSNRTVGLLQHLEDESVEAVLFEGAWAVGPAGRYHYAMMYGDRGEFGALWSAAGGFVPVSIPRSIPPHHYAPYGGLVAVIPGEIVVARTADGLNAMGWDGQPIDDPGWPDGFEADAVYPVLADSAILFVHREADGPLKMEAGASIWRPHTGFHHITSHEEGWVQGPSNAYYGFTERRDRLYRLEWPADEKPTARRVLSVSGLFRTVSSISPDGRFVVSGKPDIKGVRNFARFHENYESQDKVWRTVSTRTSGVVEPIWLHRRFGAPSEITVVPCPDWIPQPEGL
ncbi:MAG: hypothetical protein AAFV77_02400 [Planctomycetota bacterium]